MTFQHRELRADPGIAPGERNIDPPKRRSIWPSIAVVAAASAFGGVIWYAYHQSAGTAGNGMPPLVKAEAGPTKVKPDNPGGQDIPFQDSTVYDRLAPNNGQKPVAEKLLPPPEEPATRTPPRAAAGRGYERRAATSASANADGSAFARAVATGGRALAAAGRRRRADRACPVAWRDRHPAAAPAAAESRSGRAARAAQGRRH